MKKSIKYLIIILLVIAIICLIALITVNKNKQKNNDYLDKPSQPDQKYIEPKEKYEYNEFEFLNVSTEDLIQIYFNRYKDNMLNDIQKAYNILDKEYREKRFGDINGYKSYIDKNYDKVGQAILISYKLDSTNNGYTQYVCLDQYGNYYIFRENAIMDYTVILDTYTIDLPEFLEKYNNANEQQKVALNIDKFMQAINAGDYKYAYNCLADSYKNNYFKTQESFEAYAKQNFYANNNVQYNNFEQQGDVYTYSVVLTNKDTNEQMNKTFIMKLGEGTEFEMSFDV